MKRSWMFAMLRVLVGTVFAVSGYFKLLESPHDFFSVILSYKIVDASIAWPLAVWFPWAELVTGVFLIAGLWTREALVAAWAMNTVFMVTVASALLRHLPLKDCGCFGTEGLTLSLPQVLTMDAFLWAACLLIIVKLDDARRFSLDSFHAG